MPACALDVVSIFIWVVVCSSRPVTNLMGIALACLFISSRSRPACNWNVESPPPAFSAPSGLSSAKKGASGGPSLPRRNADVFALVASDVSTAVGGDLQIKHDLTRPVAKRSRSSTASRSTETCHKIVGLFHDPSSHLMTLANTVQQMIFGARRSKR